MAFMHRIHHSSILISLLFLTSLVSNLFLYTFALSSDEKNANNVTIKSWEYCQGCRELVDIYSKAVNDEMLNLKKKASSKTIDAGSLIDHFCDGEIFLEYQDFVKLSCIKILEEFRIPFLESFKGTTSESLVTNKKESFTKKQKICVDTIQACKSTNFEYPPAIGTKRNRCAACHVIANDIDMIKRSKNRKISLKSILERDDFCDRLGYNHAQYSWLETLCDEIMEEKIDQIIDVISFHDQVARSGFAPSQSMPEMLCEEFYGCLKDMKEDKTKIKKIKKKSNKKHRDL